MSESLRSHSNQRILADTSAIVVQDRKLTLRLLIHLQEIERRKLHLQQGYSSMFEFCTRHLRFSEPAAARRIRTARCLARFPELSPLLEAGDVNLSTVSLVAGILKPVNFAAIVPRIRGKSQREVRAVVAEYEPSFTLPPDRVRPVVLIVPPAENHCRSGGKKSSSIIEATANDEAKCDDKQVAAVAAPSREPVAAERRAVVQFAAREEVLSKLQCVRSLASHRLRGSSLEEVIELLADYFLAREDPAKRQERRTERARKESAGTDGGSTRTVPARLRDEVFVRDERQCSYVGPTGRRCESTHTLQVDHIVPVARGGASTADNLRLLCAQHNRLEAERLMGPGICRPPSSH